MIVSLFPPLERASDIVLELDSVTIGYQTSLPIAQGIQVQIGAGQTFALVGGNGSGKTTLLKTIAGLLEPIAGTIRIQGRRPAAASQFIAWLGQFHPSNQLLPLRVRDVVRMAHFPHYGLIRKISLSDEKITDQALEFVSMHAFAKKTLGELSGGQRQRVFLAYAIARRAPLVLLDEPQQNLDAQGHDLISQTMELWKQAGTAIVVATHDLHESGKCDQILQFPFSE